MKIRNYELPLGKRTIIMGVLNITPDSFSDGGRYLTEESALERALEMIKSGADMIDIGGESSRPGSIAVSEEEEIARIVPVIKRLRALSTVIISADTYKIRVAEAAIEAGADLINDITALTGDNDMVDMIARNNAGVILMHMRGVPGTMQDDPYYDDIIGDIKRYLTKAVLKAINAGIMPGKIMVDPGIGFGKTLEHNLLILKHLDLFKEVGKPVVVGVSRKSFIGQLTGKEVSDRLAGTIAATTVSIINGADVVRVHDISEIKDATKIVDGIINMNGVDILKQVKVY
jgi:dihydropteroate synthase